MNQGQTVFAQLMRMVSHDEFSRCVERYEGNRGVRRMSCWDQFLAMSFAQLTYRESLRDIEVCLEAQGRKLYHAGFRCAVKRSTLADANEWRDWRIYADLAQSLIALARPLYADTDLGLDLNATVYALDAPPSISAWPSFPGRTSVAPRAQSSCIRCSICKERFLFSSMSRTAKCTMSVCSICSRSSPGHSW